MQCASCGARPAYACAGCGAVFFCGVECALAADHRPGDASASTEGAGNACARARAAMDDAENVLDFGELEARMVDEVDLEASARAPGRASLGGAVPWPRSHRSAPTAACAPPSGPRNWAEFFARIGAAECDSAVAEELHWVMASFEALLLADGGQALLRSPQCDRSRVHARLWYCGPEGELAALARFGALAWLLPGAARVDVRCVGPCVAVEDDGACFEICERVVVTTHRGVYCKALVNALAADSRTAGQAGETLVEAVVGVNAGLAAFDSWGEALSALVSPRAPRALFTDYTAEAAAAGAARARAVGCAASEPALCAFRPATVVRGTSSLLPCVPSAFSIVVAGTAGSHITRHPDGMPDEVCEGPRTRARSMR